MFGRIECSVCRQDNGLMTVQANGVTVCADCVVNGRWPLPFPFSPQGGMLDHLVLLRALILSHMEDKDDFVTVPLGDYERAKNCVLKVERPNNQFTLRLSVKHVSGKDLFEEEE